MYRTARVGLLLLLVGAPSSTASAGKEKRNKNVESLSLEGATWSLQIDLPRFKIDERATRPDGSGTMIRGGSRKTDVIVSVFLERASDLHSTEECKEHYWSKASKSPLPKSDIEHKSTDSMALVHWVVREYQGIPLMQKNINAYMYRDGVCIDIHLSKVQYEPEDDALFSAVLDSVRYSDE